MSAVCPVGALTVSGTVAMLVVLMVCGTVKVFSALSSATLAVTIPLSVSVQVVLETTQEIKSVVTGTAVKPKIVFDAVAALPQVVVKLPVTGYIVSVPAVPLKPRVGVTVQLDAVELDVLGMVPAEGALAAFVPP